MVTVEKIDATCTVYYSGNIYQYTGILYTKEGLDMLVGNFHSFIEREFAAFLSRSLAMRIEGVP